jgi:hypothetical protein
MLVVAAEASVHEPRADGENDPACHGAAKACPVETLFIHAREVCAEARHDQDKRQDDQRETIADGEEPRSRTFRTHDVPFRCSERDVDTERRRGGSRDHIAILEETLLHPLALFLLFRPVRR